MGMTWVGGYNKLKRDIMKTVILLFFLGITSVSAQQSTLLFAESFPDLNLGDRGWYDGVGDVGYRLIYDDILQKNVMYEEWTNAGSGTGNSDPAYADGVFSALRRQFTPSAEITVHLVVKYHKYIEFAGANHHHGVGRGYGTWTALNGPLTTYIEPSRADHGEAAVMSNGELWVGPSWAQDPLEAMGYTGIQNPPNNNWPLVPRTFMYKWREPAVTHTDMNNINWLVDDQWYELALNVKSSITDAKVVFLIREYGTTNWTTLSNESGFNMGNMDELFNQYWIGSYLHNNRQEGAKSYTGWVRVYQGDAISDGTIGGNLSLDLIFMDGFE